MSLRIQAFVFVLLPFLLVGCGDESASPQLHNGQSLEPHDTGYAADQFVSERPEEDHSDAAASPAHISPHPSSESIPAARDESKHVSENITELSVIRQPVTRPAVDTSGEKYAEITETGFQSVVQRPLSTFSIDVDTASYSNVRRFLESGQLPPANAVRIEELINYFSYEYQPPKDGRPFSVNTEVANCPWDRQRQLVRIGLKGQVVEKAERQSANLVFLVDISGSMRPENKLPLVKRSLHRLLEELNERDRVAIVTYASGVQIVLSPTPANRQHLISQAIDGLHAGGSTNGSAGLQTAYQVARQQFVKYGTNRVILCSDGDFNAGITNESDLVKLISREAKSGVFLSVLGFGTGNYQDAIAEKLADHGNGHYAYIDSYSEARKVLIDQMSSTLETIAKDVKIQVEFNPAHVASYRLIGYENRTLAARDFRDDHKDAGEIGAGHSVTALYEVVPVGVSGPDSQVPELRYQQPKRIPVEKHGDELLTVRLRYKLPSEDHGKEFTHTVVNSTRRFEKASADFRFAAAVATFGMILRDSEFAEHLGWDDVRNWSQSALGQDKKGYRIEFLNLVSLAEQMVHRPHADEAGIHSTTDGVSYIDYEPAATSWEQFGRLSGSFDAGKFVTLVVIVGVSYGIATLRNISC
ncbi:vWA domain-containing protein [Thalassoglobus polymorphus]|uniref:von Willebrand factor n=1 Tax=Thalassoglobus polymorphus TaxID=2527994 RepID=A0A517QN62_9PLAN|nr:VWA domain-containing protein [Thalassoglobus polymorphus]QDT33076.1 von Willebrand factor [Thalassoglobus polymorphus]